MLRRNRSSWSRFEDPGKGPPEDRRGPCGVEQGDLRQGLQVDLYLRWRFTQAPTKGIRRALVLNHRRDNLAELVAQLRRAGYDVVESTTVDESDRLVRRHQWALAILNPLVLRRGGVEFGHGALSRLRTRGFAIRLEAKEGRKAYRLASVEA